LALQAGNRLLNGQYRIVRQLGRGGFGFVYLAKDTLLDKDVAIKELIPGLVGDETMIRRFLAEARATMELTHERIVRTHNIFSEAGNYYNRAAPSNEHGRASAHAGTSGHTAAANRYASTYPD
jgi:serine/threonine protein kinase